MAKKAPCLAAAGMGLVEPPCSAPSFTIIGMSSLASRRYVESRPSGAEPKGGGLALRLSTGESVECDLVLACDGRYSKLRQQLAIKHGLLGRLGLRA